MTTVPRMSTSASAARIASTARASAAILLPRPCSGAAASAPASVTRKSSSARLRLVRGSINYRTVWSDIAGGSLADAPAPDRQFVCLYPEILLAREPAIAIPIGVDAGPLQHCGDPHARAGQDGDETLEEDLILIELD